MFYVQEELLKLQIFILKRHYRKIDLNFTLCSLAKLALNRFGIRLDDVSKRLFAKYGFKNQTA